VAIKPRQLVGIILGSGVVVFTIYSIKKYYDEKKQNAASIGLDEAKEIVEEGKTNLNRDQIDPAMEDTKIDARNQAFVDMNFSKELPIEYGNKGDKELSAEEMERLVGDARDHAHWNTAGWNVNEKDNIGLSKEGHIATKTDELAATLDNMEDETEDDLIMDGPDPEELQQSKGYFEEDKELLDDLRYEPNSIEAREQFINMELVVLGRDNDTRDVVGMLYDHPFNPISDEDRNLWTRLMDHRIKFFGEQSKWINEVTFGDVIMYYGKNAEYNCGEDVRHWVDYFLTCADINNITLTSEEFAYVIDQLNKHIFFNPDLQSHGLFGLTSFQMTEAARVAQGRVDGMVTYDIEFHNFITAIIERQ
jgi:hypothetical protein